MDFNNITSMNNLMRNQKLEGNFKIKKESGQLKSHENHYDLREKNRQFIESYKEMHKPGSEEAQQEKLKKALDKVYSGKKLTPEEEKLVQEKAPEDYQRLKDIRTAKKAAEKELKACKTKEDVERVKMKHLGQSLSVVNTVMNDPAISEDKKLAIVMGENAKTNNLRDVVKHFVDSGKYKKLPTEAEKQQVEKAEAEAREAEIRGEEGNNTKAEELESSAGNRADTEAGESSKTGPANENVENEKTAKAQKTSTPADDAGIYVPDDLRRKVQSAKAGKAGENGIDDNQQQTAAISATTSINFSGAGNPGTAQTPAPATISIDLKA